MTRGNARELAVHLIYGREFTGDTPVEVVRLRLEEGYYEQLAAEYEIYTERPTEKQVKYLEDLVAGVHAHEELLNTIIGKYSIGWDVKRISRLNRVISCTAHVADHAMITQLPCTGHMTDHALIT